MWKATDVLHRQYGLNEIAPGTEATIPVLPVFATNLQQIIYDFIFSKEIQTHPTFKCGSGYRRKNMKIPKQISNCI